MIHVDEESLMGAIERSGGTEEQGFYREAMAAAGVGTWRLDRGTGLCTWDAVSSQILGLAAAGHENNSLLPFHPDDQEKVAAAVQASFATGEIFDMECRIVRPDGDTRWVRSRAQPREEAHRERRWLCGVLFDIEGRKRSELALQGSRRQLATLIDNLPGFAYRCAPAAPWRLEYASDGALAVTGYSSAEWLSGRIAWADIVHPDDRADLEGSIAAGTAGRQRFNMTYRIHHRDGSVRWLNERGQAVYDDQDRPTSLEGFIGDVTEQKLTELSLSTVLSGTLDCVYSLDRRMRFTYMNARAQAHYGGRDLVGQSVADVVPGSGSTEFGECYTRVLREQRAESIEAYFPPTDSWFEAHATPTEGGLTVFYRDITPRKRAEVALR